MPNHFDILFIFMQIKWSICEEKMASNFQIYSYKTRESLHLKLNGDFDGSSAYELINILNETGTDFWEIFIDTKGLKSIHPFGRAVFKKKLGNLNNKLSNLIFIEENGYKISAS
jgi:hypothetical protein